MTDRHRHILERFISGKLTKSENGTFFEAKPMGMVFWVNNKESYVWKEYEEVWQIYSSLPLVKALE